MFPDLSLISEVPVLEDGWGYHCPQVNAACEPGGDDLDPHGGGVGGVGGDVSRGVRLIPVGQGHHHIEGGQREHQVEQRPGVGDLQTLIESRDHNMETVSMTMHYAPPPPARCP